MTDPEVALVLPVAGEVEALAAAQRSAAQRTSATQATQQRSARVPPKRLSFVIVRSSFRGRITVEPSLPPNRAFDPAELQAAGIAPDH